MAIYLSHVTGSSETPSLEPALELAVVIPTYNERENVIPLLAALHTALAGSRWEVIFVDDNSPDGTAEHIRAIAASNRHIRVLERIGRHGLSSACIEGMLATPAPYIAVMDADLQHDESMLPSMLEQMKLKGLDIVVASRNVAGGSMGEFSGRRIWLSNLGSRLSRWVCRCNVSDAMSGFFIVRRTFFQEVAARLTGTGFKILVDLLGSSSRPVRLGEMPYCFRKRERGESKLDVNVELEYLYLVIDKIVGDAVPTRFVLFVLVGSLSLLIHLCVLALLYVKAHVGFVFSQFAATWFAMTFNFLLNNLVTFRDRRLHGWRILRGLLTFYFACCLGAVINVSFAQKLLRSNIPWYLSGFAGIAISSVWNYGITSILTWRHTQTSVKAQPRSSKSGRALDRAA